MRPLQPVLAVVCALVFWGQLSAQQPPGAATEVVLRELSDSEYPDHPYLESRHTSYGKLRYHHLIFLTTKNPGENFRLVFVPESTGADTLVLENVPLAHFIPQVPDALKADSFLTTLCLAAQEWNRLELAFQIQNLAPEKPRGKPGANFPVSPRPKISRVLLVNNCLAAGMWEVQFFASRDAPEMEALAYHGWFNFPRALYRQIFESRNRMSFEHWRFLLEQQEQLPHQVVYLQQLRTLIDEKEVSSVARNKGLPPADKGQKRMKKLVLNPPAAHRMDEFLTDKTNFSAFVAPGIFKKSSPRKTELGRFSQLTTVYVRHTKPRIGTAPVCHEIELRFSDAQNQRHSNFIIGGLLPRQIPVLTEGDYADGFSGAMGIGMPVFDRLETPGDFLAPAESPFFALLLDENDRWLDPRTVGLYGPTLHFDRQGALHIWLLGYGRQAVVGHFVVDLSGFDWQR